MEEKKKEEEKKEEKKMKKKEKIIIETPFFLSIYTSTLSFVPCMWFMTAIVI